VSHYGCIVNKLLLLAGALSALGFAAVFAVALHTGRGLYDDAELFRRVSGSDLSAVDRAGERTLATIDVGSLVVGAMLLGAIAFLQGRIARAVAAVALVGLSVASAELLKHGLAHIPGALVSGRLPTFPSGHTAVAVSLGLALVLASPSVLRPVAALVGAAYAAAVGFSLVVLGWHFPSDVIGSFLLCGFWASVVGLVLGSRTRRPAVSVPGVVLALCAVAAGLFIAAVVASRHPAAIAEVRTRESLVALGALLGALSLGVFTAFAALFEERRA
jgi:membrane-associated phospholipid phosphatase